MATTLPVTGLLARYKSSDPASINASNGATITTWNDISGNNKHLTGTATYNANVVNGKGAVTSVDGGLDCPNFFTSTGNRSFYAVWKLNNNGTEPIWDNSANFWVNTGTINPQSYKHVFNTFVAGPNSRTDGWHSFTHLSDISNSTYAFGLMACGIDGCVFAAQNGGQPVNTGQTIEIPRSGSVSIAEIIVYDRKVTWTEHHKILEYLHEEYAVYSPIATSKRAVVAIGNSTTQQGYTAKLTQLLEDLQCPVYNIAVSAGVVTTMQDQATEILELVNDLRSRNINVILILHHGHNNGFNTTVSDHIKSSQFTTLRATGAKLLTLTSSCRYDQGQGVEDDRIIFNNWLRSADALNYIDAVYNLGGTPEFGQYGDNGTTTGSRIAFSSLWADGVHPTPAGGAKQAELIQPSVRLLFADMETPTLVAGTVSVVDATLTRITLRASAPVGGKGPYTYKWYASMTSGFTPGVSNVLNGQNDLELDHIPPMGSTWYYVFNVTDSRGTTVFSPQKTASLRTIPEPYRLPNIPQVEQRFTPAREFKDPILLRSEGIPYITIKFRANLSPGATGLNDYQSRFKTAHLAGIGTVTQGDEFTLTGDAAVYARDTYTSKIMGDYLSYPLQMIP